MSEVTSVRDTIPNRIARIRIALKDRVLSRVAEGTELHANTVRNIAKGSEQMFSLPTIEKLENYLFSRGA